MSKPITAFEYLMLSKQLAQLDELMKDPFVRANTNVEDVYQVVLDVITAETDPFLEKEIYTIPNILKPIS